MPLPGISRGLAVAHAPLPDNAHFSSATTPPGTLTPGLSLDSEVVVVDTT